MKYTPIDSHRTTCWLLLALVMGCAALFSASVARAQAGPSLSITTGPAAATVSVSGLDAGTPFNGFDITLAFDAAVADVTGVTGAGAWNTNLVAPVINNAAGTVQVVGIATTPSCGTGCALFTVTFTPKGAGGASAVSVLSSQLATTSGQPLPPPAGPAPGAVVPVGGGSASSPTPTTPSSVATPTATPPGASSTATPTPVQPAVPTATPGSPGAPSPTATRTSTVPAASPTQSAGAGSTPTATPGGPAVPSPTPPGTSTSTVISPTQVAGDVASPTAVPTQDVAGAVTTPTPRPPATGSGSPATGAPAVALALIAACLLLATSGLLIARRRGLPR